MTTVGADEAQAHFSELLKRSSHGESFIVVDHGKPLACLGPLPAKARRRNMNGLFVRARNLRARIQPDATPIKDDIAHGRL